jgi:YidC/Oxa1 family membrane protein insertase
MTLTDLNNHELKKSKLCERYIYIFHAPQSTHKIYTESAFDNYDVIFCNGKYQVDEIRFREKKNFLKKKILVKTGYLYFDYLKKNLSSLKKIKKKTILFAPTWTKQNILLKHYAKNIISDLLRNNFKVIFRPHPEHIIREKESIKEIKFNFNYSENFKLDENSENLNSIEDSEAMITDYSGIFSEFLFSTYKAIFFTSCEQKINNKNFNNISLQPFEEAAISKFSIKFNPNNIKYIINNYETLIKNFRNKKKMIKKFKKENFYNLGKVSKEMIKFFKI